jgi:hypothetical protein
VKAGVEHGGIPLENERNCALLFGFFLVGVGAGPLSLRYAPQVAAVGSAPRASTAAGTLGYLERLRSRHALYKIRGLCIPSIPAIPAASFLERDK